MTVNSSWERPCPHNSIALLPAPTGQPNPKPGATPQEIPHHTKALQGRTNGGDSSSHGTWRIRGNGTVSLDELVGNSSVPVTGDECSLPKDGTIQLNTSHFQKNVFLKKE